MTGTVTSMERARQRRYPARERGVRPETHEQIADLLARAAEHVRGYSTYKHYLASREWALRRRAVRLASGGKCERCHARQAPGMAVHHLNYDRIYREDIEDLQDTCRGCHDYLSGGDGPDPLLQFYIQVEDFGIRWINGFANAAVATRAALEEGQPHPSDPNMPFDLRLDVYFFGKPWIADQHELIRTFMAWVQTRYTPRQFFSAIHHAVTPMQRFIYERAVTRWRNHTEPQRMPALHVRNTLLA